MPSAFAVLILTMSSNFVGALREARLAWFPGVFVYQRGAAPENVSYIGTVCHEPPTCANCRTTEAAGAVLKRQVSNRFGKKMP